MLLDPRDWSLAQRSDEVFPRLGAELRARVTAETHLSALEYATSPQRTVEAAVRELARTRAQLADALAELGHSVAAAGTHPFTLWTDTEVSPAGRSGAVHRAMRELARREPTFAQHVHVGVEDPDDAVRLLGRLRAHLPLLLALSANSPFWQGRDTGLASARTPVWQAFPRTGIPRAFASYEDWVQTVDLLVRCGAFADHTFLWWDVRLQPRYGTVEVRVMDAQTGLADAGALCALVQAVARLELEESWAGEELLALPEVLEENRFLAARDGMDAELIDPAGGCRTPVRDALRALLDAAAPHAQDLGCAAELEAVLDLAQDPGAERQRRVAGPEVRTDAVVEHLAEAFVPAAVVR